MKQNNNKNITKITSGALVLLLASGGLFSSSSAKDIESTNVEKVIVDKKLLSEEKDKIEEKESKENLDKNEVIENEEKNIEEVLDNKSDEKNDENPTIQNLVDNIEINKTDSVDSEEKNLDQTQNEVKSPEVSNDNAEKIEDIKEVNNEENLIIDEQDTNHVDELDYIEKDETEISVNLQSDKDIVNEKSLEDKAEEEASEASKKESIKEEVEITEQKNEENDSEALQVAPVIKKVAVRTYSSNLAPKTVSYQNQTNYNGKYINNYNNKKEFLEMLASHSSLAKEYNIFPEVMMGQAILESGWGQSGLAKYNKNLFGVKVPYSERGKGKGVVYKTYEEIDGKTIRISDEFRKFDTYEQSIRQYLNLLTGNYYSSFGVNKAKDYKEQIQRIKNAGYATDSRYVNKVLNVISGSSLSDVANKYLGSTAEKPKTILVKDNNSSTNLKASKTTSGVSKDVKRSNPVIVENEVKNISSVPSVKKTPIKKSVTTKTNKVKNIEKPKVIKDVKKESENKIEISNPVSISKVGSSLSVKKSLIDKDSKEVDSKKTSNLNAEKSTKTILKSKSADLVDKNIIDKAENKNYRKNQQVTENKVKTESSYKNIKSDNVQTGVGSLSSVLLTLSASSMALFSSRKRK
ncbi:glucosaminidase domain-containing protein [Anaerococcus ihuae]|uniref:glucosaminidase domain-containing protein n=1 Tax=Anaerococcus ihuae TaxID=2899519 RepID=UPI001F00206F|nr:glucosaminidase domain-containing protein [Anaerococcus ihuae]